MYTDFMNKMFTESPTFAVPMLKFNKLAAANLERMVKFQQRMLVSYMDIGLGQMKAAAEVASPQDMPAFFRSQMEASMNLRIKMMDDIRELADLAFEFKADFEKLTQENASEFTPKVIEKAAA